MCQFSATNLLPVSPPLYSGTMSGSRVDVLEEGVTEDLAEVLRVPLVLLAVDGLVGQEEHLVLDPRGLQLADDLVSSGPVQVDASDRSRRGRW